MPLYEYRCRKCGALIEKIQTFSDPPLSTCQKCGGKLERLISSSALQFKGSGWYVTDYARKSAPSETGKESAKTESSSEKKSDSSSGESKKPSAKPPSKS